MRCASSLGAALLVLAIVAGSAGASRDSIAENRLRVSIDASGAASTASCQLMVLADLVVGSFSSETVSSQLPVPEAPGAVATSVDLGNATSSSTSSCAQPVGTIRLFSGAAAGWDEGGAPSDSAWGATAPAANVGVLSNRIRIHLEGSDPSAVAGCQMLIAIDALVLSASIDAEDDEEPTGAVALQDADAQRAAADCSQHVSELDITLSG